MPLETLSKYTPTELEKIVESPCPFYIPRKRVFSGVYAPAHELATNLLAIKLQQKLKELQLTVSTEQPLRNINGRLDLKITKGKIRLKNSGKTLAIVEVKTGFKACSTSHFSNHTSTPYSLAISLNSFMFGNLLP